MEDRPGKAGHLTAWSAASVTPSFELLLCVSLCCAELYSPTKDVREKTAVSQRIGPVPLQDCGRLKGRCSLPVT